MSLITDKTAKMRLHLETYQRNREKRIESKPAIYWFIPEFSRVYQKMQAVEDYQIGAIQMQESLNMEG